MAKGGQPDLGGRPLSLRLVEGIAIVSADGMIADAGGVQPSGLLLEADQHLLRETLNAADVVLHGRHSREGGPSPANRRRIVLTHRVEAPAHDPADPQTVLWNPQSTPFAAAWDMAWDRAWDRALDRSRESAGAGHGRLAVIGGTAVFGLFLDWGYDVFNLSVATRVRLPGGRPVFPGVPAQSPAALLERHGLKSDTTRVLDREAGLELTTWRR